MRKDPTVEALSQLKALELRGAGVERVSELRPFLAHRSPYVVARAVKIALEMELADLSADLAKSFSRFLRDGAKTDPGCAVKIASWPQRSIAFAAKFLDSAVPEVAPEAANAMGNARRPEAFAPLADHYGNPRLRPHIAMALAVLKTDEALEFLIARLKLKDPDARRALEIYRNDENIWNSVRAASHKAG